MARKKMTELRKYKWGPIEIVGKIEGNPKPLDLEKLADEIIRVEFPTYEQTTIPQMKNAIIRKKQQIRRILNQRVKSAVQGLLEEIRNRKKRVEEDYENGWISSELREHLIAEIEIIENISKKWFPDIEND